MPRRPEQANPEQIRQQLARLLQDYKILLRTEELRPKVIELAKAFHLLRDMGSSLLPVEGETAARDRILLYFQKYPLTVIHGDELMVVSGIQEWARRVRELRREHGWAIASGATLMEMGKEEETGRSELDVFQILPEEYILLSIEQDREAAYRWRLANDIRRKKNLSVKNKILQFLRENVGRIVTGEELRYVAGDKTEWARRVRELRTEEGWPIITKTTGRPDLPIGGYLLEQDRQIPAHDRHIPDSVRGQVLRRDNYSCRECGWNHALWNPSDPRHLELHHCEHHAKGGENTEGNLITVCNICHHEIHRREG